MGNLVNRFNAFSASPYIFSVYYMLPKRFNLNRTLSKTLVEQDFLLYDLQNDEGLATSMIDVLYR